MSNWAIGCYIYIGLFMLLNVGFTVAFTIGGLFDIIHMLRELREAEIDDTDDGRV
jgi:hypothetical protein